MLKITKMIKYLLLQFMNIAEGDTGRNDTKNTKQ